MWRRPLNMQKNLQEKKKKRKRRSLETDSAQEVVGKTVDNNDGITHEYSCLWRLDDLSSEFHSIHGSNAIHDGHVKTVGAAKFER